MILNNKKLKILYFLFIVCIILHLFSFIRCTFLKFGINIDFLSYNKQNNLILNGWATSHFILYLIVGYLYPNEYLYVFSLGIIWEIYEYLFAKDKIFISNIYKFLCGEKDGIMQMVYNKYDPLINLVGYIIGNFLSKRN